MKPFLTNVIQPTETQETKVVLAAHRPVYNIHVDNLCEDNVYVENVNMDNGIYTMCMWTSCMLTISI